MAQESKAVDLGKLQDDLRNANASMRAASTIFKKRKSELESAMNRFDASKKSVAEAQISVDKAKQAVLDGARSVAQG